ncbi:MAG TPA: alkaline phosphatase D family protein, partial [Nevskiaceae bacterium]|nr:alkaline phosphatase D family protein [Nevskiaceae bacterium]
MGRRRVTRKNKGGLSRRSFLKGAGAASALLATQPFLGAGAQDDDVSSSAAAGSSPFHHGVASGDPRSERVMLWTRVTLAAPPDSIPVTYVVATDTALANIVTSGTASADAAHDYTVKVDVAGLSPGTTYYYRFSANGMDSQIGRTRTLPVGSVDRLRIAVLSCASLAHGYFNAYRCVAHRADLDLVVHLGDYIYEYGDGDYGSARNYQPPHEIITLHDYRTRHNQYKRDPDVKALHRQHPVVAIWDDHEFADNAWLGGAANHQPDTEGAWTDRVNAAVQAYYEWMPIRPPASGDIRNIYRSFRIGDLAELFMLEERITARDQQLDSNLPGGTSLFTESGAYLDTSRHMISNTQQNWLLNHMHQSTAQWKLIGQGVV